MGYKIELQNNNTELQGNNTDLQSILDTINSLPDVLDTSDATAIASDIAEGKTAYVNGVKIIGTAVFSTGPIEFNSWDISLNKDGSVIATLFRDEFGYYDMEISGSGEMMNWALGDTTEFRSYNKSITSVVIKEGVTNIGNFAFDGCTSLTSVTLPNSIISIGEKAFASCAFTYINVPNSVTSIGKMAFYSCSQLKNLPIPPKVTIINEQTFYGCNGLTEIVIPDGIVTIDKNAFYNCIYATKVVIPSTVTSIGNFAFFYCNKVSVFKFMHTSSSTLTIGSMALDRDLNTNLATTIYLPNINSKPSALTNYSWTYSGRTITYEQITN